MESIKKIVLLSTGDVNGAYEAIYNLALSFNKEGHKVVMLVKTKSKPDDFVIQYNAINKNSFLKRLYLKIEKKISRKFFKSKKIIFDPEFNFLSIDENKENISVDQAISQIGFVPEIIISGMTNDFLNSTDLLALQKGTNSKVYNIAVDMNHFTGGCHYAWDCKGFINGCDEKCPAILSKFGKDLAKKNFETKLKNARLGKFKIVTMSNWTQMQAQESKIYNVQEESINVNSMVDTQLFNDKNREIAKRVFDLDGDKFYILMGCQNVKHKRKGFEFLIQALKILYETLSENQRLKIQVLIVSREITNSFDEIPFEKKHIKYINDNRLLSLLYQSTNIFVNSSIEDAGPMMVSQALACGTPVAGFDMGVVNNMVENEFNGYKARLKDSNDLAKGIKTIFELTPDMYKEYSKNAVLQVQKYSSLDNIITHFN